MAGGGGDWLAGGEIINTMAMMEVVVMVEKVMAGVEVVEVSDVSSLR